MTDLYETLGSEKDADHKALKKAYLKRARETHPDTGGSKEEFQAVERAYRILKDPDERAHYDRTGKAKDDGPSTEDWAQSLLDQMFNHVLEQDDMLYEDIFETLRGHVKDMLKQNTDSTKKQALKVKRAETAIKKTSRKSDANPVLLEIMGRARDAAQALLEKFQKEREIFAEALSLVDGYSFAPDPKPPGAVRDPWTRVGSFEDLVNELMDKRYNWDAGDGKG